MTHFLAHLWPILGLFLEPLRRHKRPTRDLAIGWQWLAIHRGSGGRWAPASNGWRGRWSNMGCSVTRFTALRDLAGLVTRQLIEQVGSKGPGVYYVPTDRLRG